MHAALMRERVGADIRLAHVFLQIGNFIEICRDFLKSHELIVSDQVRISHFQFQVGNERREVAVATALAKAIDRAVDLRHAP